MASGDPRVRDDPRSRDDADAGRQDPAPDGGRAMSRPVSLALLAALAFGLSWPALLNGGALLFFDSLGYLSLGEKAVGFVMGALQTPSPPTGGAAAAAPTGGGAMRSPFYSAFAYVFEAFDAVVAAQALAVAAAIACLARGVRAIGAVAAIYAAAAFLSGAAFFASWLTPDFLAGVLLICFVVPVLRPGDVGRGEAAFLVLLATAAAAAHASHLLLAAGLGVFVAALALVRRRGSLPRTLAIALLPACLGALLNVAGGWIALGEPSLAPKRMPILSARLIADGPVRAHLISRCEEDADAYALCPYLDSLAADPGGILFGENGIVRAPADVQDRMRREEPLLLSRAVSDDPLGQLAATARNVADQFVKIGLDEFRWSRLETDAGGEREIVYERRGGRAIWRTFAAIHLAALLAAGAVFLLLVAVRRIRWGDPECDAALVILAGLALNAAICGGLSVPADRYQARIVWVATVFVAIVVAGRRPVKTSSARR